MATKAPTTKSKSASKTTAQKTSKSSDEKQTTSTLTITAIEEPVVAPAPAAASTVQSEVKTEKPVEVIDKAVEPASGNLQLSQEDVATRAYFLWEKDGWQHGRHRDHWFHAEEQLRNEMASKIKKR